MSGIKEARARMCLSQKRLAQEVGVSEITILRWEKGQSSPNSEKLKKLAQILEVTPNELLGVTDERATA